MNERFVIWVNADGTKLELTDTIVLPEWSDMGVHCGGDLIEHVTVMFLGRRASMFVDEEGRMKYEQRSLFGTEVYFTNARLRGQDPESVQDIKARAVEMGKEMGFSEDQIVTLPSSDKPEGIYGPSVILVGFEKELGYER